MATRPIGLIGPTSPGPVPSGRRDGRPARARLATLFSRPTLRPRPSVLYSRLVGLFKIVLPAAAGGLAALVLFWPQLYPDQTRFKLRSVAVSVDDLENLRMLAPRFSGQDSSEQPYTLSADQATQSSGNSEVTDLAKPRADLTANGGAWLALAAANGRFRKADQILDLWGGVNVFHDAGYELVTERAQVDLGHGKAEGQTAVRGQGPNIELEGEGFRIEDKGARVLVTGRSRVVLHGGPAAKAAAK